MFNSEILYLGYETFLAKFPNISNELKSETLEIIKELGAIGHHLMQFAMLPSESDPKIELDFIREKAIMTVTLADYQDQEGISIVTKIFADYGSAKPKSDFVKREQLPEIIKKFNWDYGNQFYDTAIKKGELSPREYVKRQKAKVASYAYLDDKNIAGMGFTKDSEIIFYLTKKLSEAYLKKNYPQTIEDMPIVFKYSGKFSA